HTQNRWIRNTIGIYGCGPTQSDTLDLFSLKDLNRLKGRVTIISADFIFHLFGQMNQERLAEYFSLLLSNQPGSSIFGLQRGSENEGEQNLFVPISLLSPQFHIISPCTHSIQKKQSRPYAAEAHWYGHSAESWKSVWEKLFDPSTVKIVTEVRESDEETQYEYIHGKRKVLWLYWSVTRI
ncbi:hypothetical protein PSTT_05123, partial [Puccinia striiformis]